jgi:GT2 family glycosyltransferase
MSRPAAKRQRSRAPAAAGRTPPRIGVVIVCYHSADFIDECLESLFAAPGAEMRVVVVDNNSADKSCEAVLDWASGRKPFQRRQNSPLPTAQTRPKPVDAVDATTDAPPPAPAPLTLLRSSFNGGYAYAVNQGLKLLLTDPGIDLFWVLNPDCVVPPATPAAIVAASRERPFALLGGRAIYYERPFEIQTDGGVVARTTGRCKSLHAGLSPSDTPMPDAASLDYITGASLIATREFIETAGLMAEDYFLYFEEVDWAFRREALPLRVSPDVIVYHRGGTAIGTGTSVRRASPFANYFNARNRVRFMQRFMRSRATLALAYGVAKATQLALAGAFEEAQAMLAGALSMPPPAAVRARITDPIARLHAFGSRK